MKKFKYILPFLMLSVFLSGCSKTKENPSVGNEVDYYIESSSIAVTEEGNFYYISEYPVSEEKIPLIYYYDKKNNISYPLCSDTSCKHTDNTCQAFIEDNECLNNAIWYFNKRIYMIERDTEYDSLVSFDKTGGDKKLEARLSVDGNSVLKGSSKIQTFCMVDGNVYYILNANNSFDVYRYSIEKKENKLITKYEKQNQVDIRISLSKTKDKIYINTIEGAFTASIDTTYTIASIDAKDDKYAEIAAFDKIEGLRGDVDSWVYEIVYDDNENFYFSSIYEDEFILNKMSLKDLKTTEIYSIKGNGNTVLNKADTDYVQIIGYSGKYIMINKSPNIAVYKDTKESTYMYFIDEAGNLIHSLEMKRIMEKGTGIAEYTYLGVVDGRVVIIAEDHDLEDLKLSDEWYEYYEQLVKEYPKNIIYTRFTLTNDVENAGEWDDITYDMFR